MSSSESLEVTIHNGIYPGINPHQFAGSCKGKVVFITGASRGIGEATARAFARCGAQLFLAARSGDVLNQLKEDIPREFPESIVGVLVTDVTQADQVKAAVDACVTKFGRIDIAIANSGTGVTGPKISEADPEEWWYAWEVNVYGEFLVARFTLPHLMKTKGYLFMITSISAQKRVPGWSSYQASKHAVNRLAEHAALEHQDQGVKVFALHPGTVKTNLSIDRGLDHLLIDEIQLAPWTMVRLTTGSDDYLSGRYVSATWDLDEVASKWKEAIIRDDALKNRLMMPHLE